MTGASRGGGVSGPSEDATDGEECVERGAGGSCLGDTCTVPTSLKRTCLLDALELESGDDICPGVGGGSGA